MIQKSLSKKSFILITTLVLFACIVILVQKDTIQTALRTELKQKLKTDFMQKVQAPQTQKPQPTNAPVLSFALIADSHNANDNLTKAIGRINQTNAKYIFGLGDYTDVGTETELKNFYTTISKTDKKVVLLPGDHDLWNGRDKTEDPFHFFNKIIPSAPSQITEGDIQFIFINNADLYHGIPSDQFEKLNETLKTSSAKVIVLLAHKAIKHPLTIHTMGYINDQKNTEVLAQADSLLQTINQIQNKKIYLLHGDLHSFGQYQMDGGVAAYAIGALTTDKNFQTPRFATAQIDAQGTLTVQDQPLSQ